MQLCNDDDDFGPIVWTCRDGFDFTLLFEETILSMAPSIMVIFLTGLRITYLRKRPRLFSAIKFQLLKSVS